MGQILKTPCTVCGDAISVLVDYDEEKKPIVSFDRGVVVTSAERDKDGNIHMAVRCQTCVQ